MTSYGYAGPVPADVWAKMQQAIGVDYSAAGLADCKVTPNTTGVQVAAGTISGWGVLDILAGPSQVNLTAPGSGQSWWMIVARRTWGATKATSFVAISAGTTSPATLPTRNTTPGVLDDQPLALVGWTAGQSQPTTVVDLRVVGMAGQQVAFDQRALGYLQDPGRQVRIGTVDWVCAVNGAGALAWVQGGQPQLTHARMTKTTTGPAYTASTWTKVTGFNFDFASGITTNGALGEFTAQVAGYYDIDFYHRWQDYGSAYYRQAAIVVGTTAPPPGANAGAGVAEMGSSVRVADWYLDTLHARGIYLPAGGKVSFWIRSDVASTFNSIANTVLNKPPYVYLRLAGA